MRRVSHEIVRNGKNSGKSKFQRNSLHSPSQLYPFNKNAVKIVHPIPQNNDVLVADLKRKIRQLQFEVEKKNKQLAEKQILIDRLEEGKQNLKMSTQLSSFSTSLFQNIQSKHENQKQRHTKESCAKTQTERTQQTQSSEFDKYQKQNNFCSVNGSCVSMEMESRVCNLGLANLKKRINNSQKIVQKLTNILKPKTMYIPLQLQRWIDDMLQKHESVCELVDQLHYQHEEEMQEIKQFYERIIEQFHCEEQERDGIIEEEMVIHDDSWVGLEGEQESFS